MLPGTQLRSSISRRSRTKSRSRFATANRSRRSAGPSAPTRPSAWARATSATDRSPAARASSAWASAAVASCRSRSAATARSFSRSAACRSAHHAPAPTRARISTPAAATAACHRRRFRCSAARTSAAARSRSACRSRLLDRRQVGGHRCRHLPGVPRPVVPVGRQAPLAQRHQLRVRPAPVQPGEGVVELPADGQQADRVRPSCPGTAARRSGSRTGRPRGRTRRPARRPCRSRRRPARAACTPGCPARSRPACTSPGRTTGRSRPASGRASHPARLRSAGRGVREHLGQPPVHDLDLAELPDHDVRRLQVAVDHPVRVGVPDRLADLLEDGHAAAAVRGRRRRAGRRACRPLMSFMARNGRPSGSVPICVDGGDAGVLELAGDLGLVDEPGASPPGWCGTGPGGP